MIVAATGHRPDKLGGYTSRTRLALGGLAIEYLAAVRPEKVIVGMGQGWDQAVASTCITLGIPFIAAIPFRGQEKIWPDEAQARYHWLLEQAESVHIVTEGEVYGKFLTKAMQDRNEWMADRADHIVALWDWSVGGTRNCICYAQKKGIPYTNLWDRWSLPEWLRDILD